MKQLLILFCSLMFLGTNINAQDSLKINSTKEQTFRKGFGIFPHPNKTMIGYRSNLDKKWSFDSKLAYTFTGIPQFNIELNVIHRHVRNEVLNFYSGFGITLDGYSPGCIVPIGFEITPFEKFKNIIFVAEASPKLTFYFSSGLSSGLSGNIGIIYFRPAKSHGMCNSHSSEIPYEKTAGNWFGEARNGWRFV